ncbi:MAG: hypothetical protein WCE52_14710, partial [Candidatus Acidiferrum sp.]
MKKGRATSTAKSKELPAYKDSKLPVKRRVRDLLSRMSLDEKAAQMVCIWREKVDTLVDGNGDFDHQKAKKAFAAGHGLG